MSSKLKELTWENHSKAERTEHARKLLKGMTPEEYHRYIYNQYVMYAVLENQATTYGAMEEIEYIARADAIKQDLEELEQEYNIERKGELLCPVVSDYVNYILSLTEYDDFMAHIYVRHFGDMYGGQMISKRNPGSGKMYEFVDVDKLKTKVRARLHDGMADEANLCFEYAMKLFEELDQ